MGLLSEEVDASDEETEINILLTMALERLAFLPYGYLVDKYRWDLYSGLADENSMNCHWVKLRMDIQGTTNNFVMNNNTKYAIMGQIFQVLLHQTFAPRKILMPGASSMLRLMWATSDTS